MLASKTANVSDGPPMPSEIAASPERGFLHPSIPSTTTVLKVGAAYCEAVRRLDPSATVAGDIELVLTEQELWQLHERVHPLATMGNKPVGMHLKAKLMAALLAIDAGVEAVITSAHEEQRAQDVKDALERRADAGGKVTDKETSKDTAKDTAKEADNATTGKPDENKA